MSRKNVIVQKTLLDAVPNNVITFSAPVAIAYLDNVGIQFNFVTPGTHTGAVQAEISADHRQDKEGNVIFEGNWILVITQGVNNATSAAYLDLNQLSAPYVRAVWRPSGAPDATALTVTLTAKML